MTNRRFLDGFAEGAGIPRKDADVHWAAWSRMLSDHTREEIEAGGFDAGRAEGARFADFFPPETPKD